ncbi:Phosphoadenosine phosphosulfate reductase [Labrenzia sp. THAF82]|uniref:phosphoadenylyl-sulfate reductase n=1 Tax=Labrenzia sp. THAF82 TaxID=2587861 RepID=UPI0012692F80|nr:phosphoadenylyl-sulfate reductase [Labrenzia sp. THAF82]QFT33840.1 Phosphoadenosine phosphosulfate reductase [Labrenzia sp. THAF82]
MGLHETFSLGVDPELGLQAEVATLNAQFEDATAQEILMSSIRHQFAGDIAMVSSFGADSAVLLHMVAQIDPSTPVLFVDTVKLFPATLLYREELIETLGLTDVRTHKPLQEELAKSDPAGMLWMTDTDACCHMRKVVPLERALSGFGSWISGRKRHQSSTRSNLDTFEIDDGRVKINPLADWTATEVLDYAQSHDLPPHPLVAQGYPSIGCLPCTSKVAPGEDPRAGRWRGQDKTECGIHWPTHGKEIDGSGI